MPAPTTSDELIELIRKSGVFDDNRLDAYFEKLSRTSGIPASPVTLASSMLRDGILTRFQAENLLQGKWRRFTIGNYRILDRIGSGGMGTVYLCEHKSMRRRSAVKVLPIAKAKDPASLERFYREARAVAALDHPNIVRAYDVDQEEDVHFLVMEYVDGISLQDLVRKQGQLNPGQAANYIAQSALGLQHAHVVAGLVHRDIKPGNIIVDRSGNVKLLDMGLARFFLDDDDLLTKKYDENVLGTADYLAPEQVVDSHEVDIRADIYSLGATFYYCLTGRTPFGDGTTAQKLIWHQTRQVKPVRSFNPDVPEGMEAVLARMMAKSPLNRFQTPAEVAQALAPWAELNVPGTAVSALSAQLPVTIPEEIGLVDLQDPERKVQPPSPGSAAARSYPSSSHVYATASNPSYNQRLPAGTPRPNGGADRPDPATSLGSGVRTAEVEKPLRSAEIDTQEQRSQADTEPARPKKKPPRKPRRQPQRSESNRVIWLVGGGIAVAGVLTVALLFGWRLATKRSNSDSASQTVQTRWYVTREPLPNSCLTIRQALDQARPGDAIVIKDSSIEERLSIRNIGDVAIEAEPGHPVTWQYPAKDPPASSMLLIDNVRNVRISGITLDGRGRVDEVVDLAGRCPGLTFENVKVIGGRQRLILVSNCSGDRASPVSLRGLTIATDRNLDSGILFRIDPERKTPRINENLVVEDCRFEGPIQTPCELEERDILRDVVFSRNKILKSRTSTERDMRGATLYTPP
jgi:serine/threonine protein kinase